MGTPRFRIGQRVRVARVIDGLTTPEMVGFEGTVTMVEQVGSVNKPQFNYDVDGRYCNEQMLEPVEPELPPGMPPLPTGETKRQVFGALLDEYERAVRAGTVAFGGNLTPVLTDLADKRVWWFYRYEAGS